MIFPVLVQIYKLLSLSAPMVVIKSGKGVVIFGS